VTDPIPYNLLPDTWAEKAHCPVCNASPLAVVHRAEAPDQMACPRCHALFEIEQKGPRIHFTALPGILNGLLGGGWVTYAEVKQTVHALVAQQSPENKTAASVPAQKAPASPEPSPFTEEVVETFIPVSQAQAPVEERPEEKPEPLIIPPISSEPVFQSRAPEINDVHTRAKDLYALGNRPDQIKEILSRDPILDKAEIQAEVDALSGVDGAKKHRQRTILWVSIVIELFIILICGVIISYWKPLVGVLGGEPGMNFVATLSANQTIAPLIATPMVYRETEGPAPRPSCPQTKDQAAALFGGHADSWYSDVNDGSWFLVASEPTFVHVPGGMSVILVDLGSAGVNSVPGPAHVNSIKSVTILCR
jgi:hypothetical protein